MVEGAAGPDRQLDQVYAEANGGGTLGKGLVYEVLKF